VTPHPQSVGEAIAVQGCQFELADTVLSLAIQPGEAALLTGLVEAMGDQWAKVPDVAGHPAWDAGFGLESGTDTLWIEAGDDLVEIGIDIPEDAFADSPVTYMRPFAEAALAALDAQR
jgi:hypothetical protein